MDHAAERYLMGAILLWNGIVFLLYAADKRKARAGQWRIPESTLLAAAFLLGGLGAFAGHKKLRHKTQHLRFRILLPCTAVYTAFALLYLLYRLLPSS